LFREKGESKAIPLQAWRVPEGSGRLKLWKFPDSRYMKEVRSALSTGRLYPAVNIPGTHFC
jgi:hypothetical protein